MKSLSVLTNLWTSLTQNSSSTNQALGIQLMTDSHRYLLQKYFDNERTFQTSTVGGQTTQSMTLTAIVSSGATSATLNAVWAGTTGTYTVTFSNDEERDVTFTNASATISWTTALTSAATASIEVTLSVTAVLAKSATSATLTTAWTKDTCQQLVSFDNDDSRLVTFTYNSTSISWTVGLSSACTTTTISTTGVQEYALPANISKITSTFIQVGQLKFVPVFLQTRMEYDRVNFLPYTSDIVNYAYIYNGKLCFWPIPSTTSNVIQFNYKARVPDFSTSFLFSATDGTAYVAGSTTYDYQKGTVTGTANSPIITGASTPNWTTNLPTGDVTKYNLYFTVSPIKGDGIWYPISTIDTATQLTLSVPLTADIAAGSSYLIAQMPVLQEDFHDMIVHSALMTYFSAIVKDSDAYNKFKDLYETRLNLLKDYAGTKQVSVDLEDSPRLSNPNLYYFGQ